MSNVYLINFIKFREVLKLPELFYINKVFPVIIFHPCRPFKPGTFYFHLAFHFLISISAEDYLAFFKFCILGTFEGGGKRLNIWEQL